LIFSPKENLFLELVTVKEMLTIELPRYPLMKTIAAFDTYMNIQAAYEACEVCV